MITTLLSKCKLSTELYNILGVYYNIRDITQNKYALKFENHLGFF